MGKGTLIWLLLASNWLWAVAFFSYRREIKRQIKLKSQLGKDGGDE